MMAMTTVLDNKKENLMSKTFKIKINNGNVTFLDEDTTQIKCFEIRYADLPKMENSSVQGGFRPVLIISNNANNKHSPTVNVYPFTSKNKNNLPVHVKLDGYGLPKESTLLIEQPLTVDKHRIRNRIGELNSFVDCFKVAKSMVIQMPILSLLKK